MSDHKAAHRAWKLLLVLCQAGQAWSPLTQQHASAACQQLLRLPTAAIERYLLQYVYLAVAKPNGVLEHTIEQLCSTSFTLAIKTVWLLQALHQDQPNNQHIRMFRERCMAAALTGNWVPPFPMPQQQWQPQGSMSHPGATEAPRQHQQEQEQQQQEQQQEQDVAGQQPTPCANGVESQQCQEPVKQQAAAAGDATAPMGRAGAEGVAASQVADAARAVDVHQQQQQVQPQVQQRTQQQEPAHVMSSSAVQAPGAAEPPLPNLPPIRTRSSGALAAHPAAAAGGVQGVPTGASASSSSSSAAAAVAGAPSQGVEASAGTKGAVQLSPGSQERLQRLQEDLGEGEQVSAFLLNVAAAGGYLAVQEEAPAALPLSSSMVLSGPASPATRQRRDLLQTSLEFVEKLCDISMVLAKLQPAQRPPTLQRCLKRLSDMVTHAEQEDGVAVWWPLAAHSSRDAPSSRRLLRLEHEEAVILNSRDKAPFLLYVEVQDLVHLHHQQQQHRHHHLRHRRSSSWHLTSSAGDHGTPRRGHHHSRSSSFGSGRQQVVQQQQLGGPLPLGTPPTAGPDAFPAAEGVATSQQAVPAAASGDAPAHSDEDGASAAAAAAAAAAVGLQVPHKRRMPSLEAIELIADQLGMSGHLPAPAEVGPPLEPAADTSASLDSGSEVASDEELSTRSSDLSGRSPLPAPPWVTAAAAGSRPMGGVSSSTKGEPAGQQKAVGGGPDTLQWHDAGAGHVAQQDKEGVPGAIPSNRRTRDSSRVVATTADADRQQQQACSTSAGGTAEAAGASPAAATQDAGMAHHPSGGRSHSFGGSDSPRLVKQTPFERRVSCPDSPAPPPSQPSSGSATLTTRRLWASFWPKGLPWQWGTTTTAAAAAAADSKGGGAGGGAGQPRLGRTSEAGSQADAEAVQAQRRKAALAVYGERWAHRLRRIARASPLSAAQGWCLAPLIVKSGDDCRQELLALQMVAEAAEVWAAAGLPLWVYPFQLLVTSNTTALMEVITDATSLHTIKARSPPGTSLSQHFFDLWGPPGSSECSAAQRRFAESLAGYSLICYLLQVKDRHNGNIMITKRGRLLHIDYGFMLSNAPGGLHFELAPWKLSREMLEVLGSDASGAASEAFDYFKVLMIQGFLALRASRHRLLSLVAILATHATPPNPATFMTTTTAAMTPAGGWAKATAAAADVLSPAPGVQRGLEGGLRSAGGSAGQLGRLERGGLSAAELLQVPSPAPKPYIRHQRSSSLGGSRGSNGGGGGLHSFHRRHGSWSACSSPLAASATSGSFSGDPHEQRDSLASMSSTQLAEGLVRAVAGPASSSSSSAARGASASPLQGKQTPSAISGGVGPGFAAGAAGESSERSGTPAGSSSSSSSGTWPCFKAGAQKVVAGMEARFVPHLGEAEVVQHVLELISSSIDATSTRQYDFYQRVLNGIL